MPLSIGVLKETFAHEARVALTPDVAAKFLELGVAINMERGAGERSHFGDALFKGVQFHADAAAVLVRVARAAQGSTADARRGRSARPRGRRRRLPAAASRARRSCARLRDRELTSFAVELIPRISRAQSMDALSSQAAAAGYKAALLAASALDKFLPMLTTAAGTIRPAQVLVIGAGVAASARRTAAGWWSAGSRS